MKKQILLQTILVLIVLSTIVSSYHPGTTTNPVTPQIPSEPPSTGNTIMIIVVTLFILAGLVIWASKQTNKGKKQIIKT